MSDTENIKEKRCIFCKKRLINKNFSVCQRCRLKIKTPAIVVASSISVVGLGKGAVSVIKKIKLK